MKHLSAVIGNISTLGIQLEVCKLYVEYTKVYKYLY